MTTSRNHSVHLPPNRSRMLGLSGAALWLMSVSLFFFLLSLWLIGTPAARQLGFLFAGLAIVPLSIHVRVIRRILRLPNLMTSEQEHTRKSYHRRFLLVLGGEIAAFIIVNPACAIFGHYKLIVPLDIIIVGLHFLPLAGIFQVPRYYLMGILFCLASVLTLWLVPAGAHVGRAAAWFVLPSLASAPVAWLIAGANLREASKSLRIARSSQHPPF